MSAVTIPIASRCGSIPGSYESCPRHGRPGWVSPPRVLTRCRRSRRIGCVSMAEEREHLDPGSGHTVEQQRRSPRALHRRTRARGSGGRPNRCGRSGRRPAPRRPRRAAPRRRPSWDRAGRARSGCPDPSTRGRAPESPSSLGRSTTTRTHPSRSPRQRTRSSNVARRRSTPAGALTANRNPSGTCVAHDLNCSSDGRRYFVAFNSTVSRCSA